MNSWASCADGRSCSTTDCTSRCASRSARNTALYGAPCSCSTSRRLSASRDHGAWASIPICELEKPHVADSRFASAIFLRPTHVKKDPSRSKTPAPPKTEYEIQVEMKAQFKALLESEQLIPRASPPPAFANCRRANLRRTVSAYAPGQQPAARLALGAHQHHCCCESLASPPMNIRRISGGVRLLKRRLPQLSDRDRADDSGLPRDTRRSRAPRRWQISACAAGCRTDTKPPCSTLRCGSSRSRSGSPTSRSVS